MQTGYVRKATPVAAIRFTGENSEEMIRWVAESGLRAEAKLTAFGGNAGDAVVVTGEDSGPEPEAVGVVGGREERAWVGNWLVIERGRVRRHSDERFEQRFEAIP